MLKFIKNNAPELNRIFGMDISRFDKAFLIKAIHKRLEHRNTTSIEEYFQVLRLESYEAVALAESLQVNYSAFFRNPLTFSVLETNVIPELIYRCQKQKKKGLRLWSAACAEGQEAYSIAILMEELLELIPERFRYMLIATDIRESNIKAALDGRYTKESVNNVILCRASNWFEKEGDLYEIKPELKHKVNFSVFDLFDERWSSPPIGIFGDFDLIFCANILFYYTEPNRKIILDKLVNSLSDGAYLITGETERDIMLRNNFKEVYPNSAIFKKNITYES